MSIFFQIEIMASFPRLISEISDLWTKMLQRIIPAGQIHQIAVVSPNEVKKPIRTKVGSCKGITLFDLTKNETLRFVTMQNNAVNL